MAESEGIPALEDKGPSWSKIRQWVTKVMALERKVGDLERKNSELSERLTILQEQMNKQSGQFEILLDFVKSSMDDKMAARAEEAALRALERLDSLGALRKP